MLHLLIFMSFFLKFMLPRISFFYIEILVYVFLIANYFFNFCGPSLAIDTACARRFEFNKESYEAFCATARDHFKKIIETFGC